MTHYKAADVKDVTGVNGVSPPKPLSGFQFDVPWQVQSHAEHHPKT